MDAIRRQLVLARGLSGEELEWMVRERVGDLEEVGRWAEKWREKERQEGEVGGGGGVRKV